MLKIVGIVVAAILAVVVVTNLFGNDEIESGAEQTGGLVESPAADAEIGDDVVADEEPAEEAAAVEAATEEAAMADDATEPDAEAAAAATPVETEPGPEALAADVEETAEDAARTEAAGSVEGLEALKEVLNASEFDFAAIQEAVAASDLDDERKDQLTTALERAAPYESLREAVLEDIRAELLAE